MKLDHLLTPFPDTNSKWFKNINMTPEIMKLPEENICSNLSVVETSF